nr:Galectin carbohydrate recognition domain [Hymenolepis microstoma]
MDNFQYEGRNSGEPCFFYEIPGGLMDKDVIEITGYFYGEKITIEVLAKKYTKNNENTAMPLQFTLTDRGKWTVITYSQAVPRQIKTGNAPATEDFQIRIVALDASFEVYLNAQQLCTQKHLIPLSEVTHISIDGDAEFTGVEFKDLLSEHEDSIGSDYNEFNEHAAEVTPGFIRLSENRRSSNRKPKPPIVVPTHGSFRAKPTLATTLEEPDVYMNSGENINIVSRTTHESVHAYADPNVSGGRTNSGSRGSSKASLRDKLHLKRGSRGSIPTPGNEHVNPASVEDVWVEEGGPEYSADGPTVLAASVPNLSSQPDKGKEKKVFGHSGHSRKHHSTSSPPAEEKKKGHGGFHFGRGSKKEKEPKPEKEKGSKKSLFGRKSSKHGSNKDLSTVETAMVVPEQSTVNVYANLDPPSEKRTLATIARSTKASPPSPLTLSMKTSHGKGSYDIQEAERNFQLQSGTYQRASEGTAYSNIEEAVILTKTTDQEPKTKLKGDSSTIASNLLTGTARAKGTVEFFTENDPYLNIPLSLEETSRVEAVTNDVVLASPKAERKKKEKLKGSSSEIANDLFGNNLAMSNEFENFTGTHVIEPLILTQENILSVNGKAYTPITGTRGSYNLEKVPESPSGKYQQRQDPSWEVEPPIRQKVETSNVQHSKPPVADLEGGGVLVTGTSGLTKKEKKHLLKGESAEIASNLLDVGSANVLRTNSLHGYPYCGTNGYNLPLKIDASNKDAQPVPYGITSQRYTQRLSNRNSVGGMSSEQERASTLPAGGVVMREDDKEKHHKRDRVSGFFKKMFKRTKSEGSVSEEEYGITEAVGTEREMMEYRTSSQQSYDFDGNETKFNVTASPRQVCLYASQLRGNKPALEGNAQIHTLCGYGLFRVPLTLTAADIPADISTAASRYTFGVFPSDKYRRESVSSYSSVSSHGTRRRVKRHEVYRSNSMDSISTWSSVTPRGSRHHYRRSARHRPQSVSSWSSVSPNGTWRRRRRSQVYAVNVADNSYISPMNIQRTDAIGVHAAYPEADSSHSSHSSIPSLYGRVVIIGQSPGFRERIQSYRKSRDMTKNRRSSGSNSSISSIASDRLPPTVVKVRGGEYATFEDAGPTIFEKRPQRREDAYANSEC